MSDMKWPTRIILFTIIVLWAVNLAHAETVWRCGNTYQDTPCAGQRLEIDPNTNVVQAERRIPTSRVEPDGPWVAMIPAPEAPKFTPSSTAVSPPVWVFPPHHPWQWSAYRGSKVQVHGHPPGSSQPALKSPGITGGHYPLDKPAGLRHTRIIATIQWSESRCWSRLQT